MLHNALKTLTVLAAVAAVAALAEPAAAWEFRARFVERIGNTDLPLAGNAIDASSLQPRRIRIQFGVFDDDAGTAPAGGFVGWNVGSIMVGGGADNSDETRTPGRLSPFVFAVQESANGDPPVPDGDPFTVLTQIDATLGLQAPAWLCGPDGHPLPMPEPTIRGLSTFASVYEITIDPGESATSYSIAYSGNLIAAVEWRIVGTPIPPEDPCIPNDPEDPVPGSVTYAPLPTPPRAFSATLHVIVPSPPVIPALAAFLVMACRTRRRPI